MQEDTLSGLIKRGSGGGFALASLISKGPKFGGLDVKRVYFGYDMAISFWSRVLHTLICRNWLRDYSQVCNLCRPWVPWQGPHLAWNVKAVDIAGLKKLQLQVCIVNQM